MGIWSGFTLKVSSGRRCSDVSGDGKDLCNVSCNAVWCEYSRNDLTSFFLSCFGSSLLFTMQIFPATTSTIVGLFSVHIRIQHGDQKLLYTLWGCISALQAKCVIQIILWDFTTYAWFRQMRYFWFPFRVWYWIMWE